MKFLLTILMLNAVIALAQTKEKTTCQEQVDTLTKLKVFTVVDEMPTIEGGLSSLYRNLSKKIIYNTGQYLNESKVVVAFVVEPKGDISGGRIIKNIKGTDLAQQLLKAATDLKWQPGKCNGKPVTTLFAIPMTVDFDY